MKKILFGILLSAISFFNLSMYCDPTFGIIGHQDIDLAQKLEPALSSAIGEEPSWESYSEWQCFPSSAIEIHYVKFCEPRGCNPETGYDVPSITAKYAGHSYEFDYDFEAPDHNSEIMGEWKDLLREQNAVCIYAAMLPPVAVTPSYPDESLWTLYNLKTLNRVWRKNYVPYLEDGSFIIPGSRRAP